MEMEEIHKEVLVRCRRQLVDDLISEVIWDHLIQRKVVTPDMKTYIQDRARLQCESPISILLDQLPKRGPNAYTDFCRCLEDSGHEHLNQLLQQTLMEVCRHSQEETRQSCILPLPPPCQGDLAPQMRNPFQRRENATQNSSRHEDFPEPGEVIDMPLHLYDHNNELMKSIFLSSCHPQSEMYQMAHRPRGRLLLIIISNYATARDRNISLKDREASDCDRIMLEHLFTQLFFHVIVKTDLSASEVRQALSVEGSANHDALDCFACIISAHGIKEGIYGSDGELLKMEDVYPMFDGAHNSTLAGKPKIFFIQASRGSTCDPGIVLQRPVQSQWTPADVTAKLAMYNLQYACNVPCLGDIATERCQSHRCFHASGTETDGSYKHPVMADFFVAHATPPGFAAFRNTQGGSWFLRALVIVFKEFSHTHSLTRMMTKVNCYLSHGESSKGYKQTCVYWSTLTKELYFFPGLRI